MLHVITVSFQQVKPFVFNLPARPTGCHNLGCIGFGDIKRGDEAKALRGFAVADPANLKFNVIDEMVSPHFTSAKKSAMVWKAINKWEETKYEQK